MDSRLLLPPYRYSDVERARPWGHRRITTETESQRRLTTELESQRRPTTQINASNRRLTSQGELFLTWPAVSGPAARRASTRRPLTGRPATNPFYLDANGDTVIEKYLVRAERAQDARERATILGQLARLIERRLKDRDRAFAVRLFAYCEYPERGVWDELERLAAITGGWDELSVAYEESLPALPEPQRADACWRLARVYAERLSLVHRAIAVLESALAIEAGHRAAYELLLNLLRKSESWVDLARILANRLAAAPLEERRHLRCELAVLHERQLGDVRGAIEQHEELAAENPGDLGVLRELDRLYGHEGRIREQLQVIDAQVGLVQDVNELTTLYQRSAVLWETKLHERGRAADCLEWALTLGTPSDELWSHLLRLYCADTRWRAAVDAYCRQAAAARPSQRAALLAEAADILASQLDDPHSAIDKYLAAERIESNPDTTWPRLIDLYEAVGDVEDAIELLERSARRTRDPHQQAALYYRAGRLAATRLDELDTAAGLLRKVLQHDPLHIDALLQLAAVYRQQGQPGQATAFLTKAAARVESRPDGIRLRVQAAECAEAIDDLDQALALYQRVLRDDPDNLVATTRVAEILWNAERYAELMPALQRLTKLASDPEVQTTAWLRLGRAGNALGRYEEAASACTQTLAIAPNRVAQRELGAAFYHLGRWRRAIKAFATLLDDHELELSGQEIAEISVLRAECHAKLGDHKQARERLELARTLEPNHEDTLRALADIDRDPKRIIGYKRELVRIAGKAEQITLLGDIGDLYHRQLHDYDGALTAYREALAIKPRSRRLLHKCLEIYAEVEDWEESLEILHSLIAIEDDAGVRARYRCTAGAICHEELHWNDKATALLRAALADDARLARASHLLETILTEAEDWSGLRAHYCEQLQHLGTETDDGQRAERVRLWTELGHLCRRHFADREGAMAALQVVAHLDPNVPDHHAELAELYIEAGPDNFGKAIAENQALLAIAGDRIDAYRALERLYRETGRDHAAQACRSSLRWLAEHGLGAIADDEAKPADDNSNGDGDGGNMPAPNYASEIASDHPRLSAELWERLRDRGEDSLVGRLLALLAPVVSAAQAGPYEHLGLHPEHALSLAAEHRLARAVRRVVHEFAIEAPALYRHPTQRRSIAFATCQRNSALVPVLVVGGSSPLEQFSESALLFTLGRYLAHLYPERHMRLLVPVPSKLVRFLQAAATLANPGRLDHAMRRLSRTKRLLQTGLSPTAFDQVVELGRELNTRDAALETAVQQWLNATERTSMRAALTLTPDLAACAESLAMEIPAAREAGRTKYLYELARTNVCEAVLAAREHLGRV